MGHGQVWVARHGKMQRNGRVGQADLHGHGVVVHQQGQLLDQIVAKQIGARDSGGIGARMRHMAKGQTGIDLVMADNGQADFGVIGAQAGGRFALGHGRRKGLDQKLRGLGIKLFQMRHGGHGVGEADSGRCGRRKEKVVVHGGRFLLLIGHLRSWAGAKQVKFL
jgi:hypothetical protein